MTIRQQRDILDHTYQLLADFNHGMLSDNNLSLSYPDNVKCLRDVLPLGASWWETSKEGTELFLEKGIEYGEHMSAAPYLIPYQYSRQWELEDHSSVAQE